jgi:hypothetical protein
MHHALSLSITLALDPISKLINAAALPPGCARFSNQTGGDRIGCGRKHGCLLLERLQHRLCDPAELGIPLWRTQLIERRLGVVRRLNVLDRGLLPQTVGNRGCQRL